MSLILRSCKKAYRKNYEKSAIERKLPEIRSNKLLSRLNSGREKVIAELPDADLIIYLTN